MVEPIGSGYAPVMFDTRLAIRFPVAIALTSATILSVAPASSAAPADGPRVGSSSVWESAIVADPEYVPVEPLGDGSPIESGTVESTRNFRDVAGPTTEPLRNADGRVVRHGLAYRSNKLTNPTDEELGRMVGAGITRVVDMRNIRERSEQPDRLPAGVDYQVADVVDVSQGVWFDENPALTVGPSLGAELPPLAKTVVDADPADRDEVFDDAMGDLGQLLGYQLMVTNSSSQRAFGDLLRALAYEDGAVVFHCSAGKDRTGIGAAYLLRILDVPMAEIDADFLASDQYLGRKNSVRLEWLHATWETIDRNYGSFEAYVRGPLGLSEADIEVIRAKYLAA
ncbi:protein-tyrosine-phosphatase [Corynebacterium xerosis]|uniref:Protein-tyrosine-phosphatase n=2 Tax=Corynebacterium xerosis TaxID=1725 RepID=A0A2N6SZ55_9CORY|nr:protein-tyrosine-phosphatase [Corynebacterium xerosis]